MSGGANCIASPLNSSFVLSIQITAQDKTAPGNFASWSVPAAILVRDGSNPSYYNGPPPTAILTSGTGTSIATPSITSDATNNCLSLSGTSPNANRWEWLASVRTTEMR